jgi:hypothetical protein
VGGVGLLKASEDSMQAHGCPSTSPHTAPLQAAAIPLEDAPTGASSNEEAIAAECAAEVSLLGVIATDRRAERLLRSAIGSGSSVGSGLGAGGASAEATSAASLSAAITAVAAGEVDLLD